MYKIPKIFHTIHFDTAAHYTNSNAHAQQQYIARSLASQDLYFTTWEKKVWNEDDFLRIIAIPEWHIPYGERLLDIGAWAFMSDYTPYLCTILLWWSICRLGCRVCTGISRIFVII